MDIQDHNDSGCLTVCDFCISLSSLDRSSELKIKKETLELNYFVIKKN